MGGYANLMNMGMLRPRGGPQMPFGLQPVGPAYGGSGGISMGQPPQPILPQPVGGSGLDGGGIWPVGPAPAGGGSVGGGIGPVGPAHGGSGALGFGGPQPVGPEPYGGGFAYGHPQLPSGWGNGPYNLGNFGLLQQLMQGNRGFGYGGY